MDLIKIVLNTIRKNMRLSLILFVLAVTGGVIHFFIQSESFVSNFKTNQGAVDYPFFKSLTDFEEITSETYDLSEEKIKSIRDIFLKFKVNFVEQTASTISFTAVSQDVNANHEEIQNAVLTLINHNRFIIKSEAKQVDLLEKELHFLKGQILQLDSMMTSQGANVSIEGIPSDLYHLYAEQLKLEEQIENSGKYELIKPVTEIKVNKRPIALFVILYLILAGFIFLIFSKKPETANQ